MSVKKLFITLLLLIFISSISFSQTPVKVLEVRWGRERSKEALGLRLVQGGGPRNNFTVDDDGTIYIADGFVNKRIMVFGNDGKFIRSIINNTGISWDVRELKVLSNGNILITSYSQICGILIIDQNGKLLFNENSLSKENTEKLLYRSITAGNYIYYAQKNGRVRLNLLTLQKETVETKITRSSGITISENELLENNFIQLENDSYLSRSFYQTKRIAKQNATTRSGSPYYVKIKGFDGPTWIGLDKEHNSYWYLTTDESGELSKETGKFVMQILIYNKFGTLIKHFQTIERGDFGGITPALDNAGNLYFAQRWYSKGVAIWKYERDW